MELDGIRQRKVKPGPVLSQEVPQHEFIDTQTQTDGSYASSDASEESQLPHSHEVLKEEVDRSSPKPQYQRRRSHSRYRKQATKKGKFLPRPSFLDFENLEREQNPMRGFFILFWIAIAWYCIITFYETYLQYGIPFRMDLALTMSDRGYELAVSDGLMILSCFMSFFLVKVVQFKLFPLRFAWILNSVWLLGWFSYMISWAFYNNWKWTQSGSFTIHCIAMLMKQASYLMSNVESFWKLKELPQLADDIGRLQSDLEATNPNDGDKANEIIHEISVLELEEEQFQMDLQGKVTGLEFPRNLTLWNFVDYMLVPTLVYEIEYPRTASFRWSYFLEKLVGTFGIFFVIVTVVEHSIFPILRQSAEIDFVTCIMRLIVPFMVCFMLLFNIIFDCICNAFAELTYFADREFYEDWWNSVSFDEYARRWNKPVHEFLLRHVYLETIGTYKLSRQNATLLTFFVSSLFHELVMFMTGKRLRPWLFLLQMFQLPLIYMARWHVLRKNKAVANAFFWFGMFLGPPLLGALYSREQFLYP